MNTSQRLAFEKAIRKGITKEADQRAKKRARNPLDAPIRNPTTDQLERCCECSIGINGTGFHKSVIIGGRRYVVTAIGYTDNQTEFFMHELLPPWTTNPKLLDKPRAYHSQIVVREGTTERYALGKLVYYRNRKFHPRPIPW